MLLKAACKLYWQRNKSIKKKKTLFPLFMDGVQLSQGCRVTTRRQFTYYHLFRRSSWYSTDRPWKDERLSWPWSRPVALILEPLDWESSALTNRSLRLLFRNCQWQLFLDCAICKWWKISMKISVIEYFCNWDLVNISFLWHN